MSAELRQMPLTALTEYREAVISFGWGTAAYGIIGTIGMQTQQSLTQYRTSSVCPICLHYVGYCQTPSGLVRPAGYSFQSCRIDTILCLARHQASILRTSSYAHSYNIPCTTRAAIYTILECYRSLQHTCMLYIYTYGIYHICFVFQV